MTGKSLKLRPLNDRVIVEGISDLDTSISGIIIPDTVSGERPQKGMVISVGPGKVSKDGKRVPLDVNVGDKIVFSKYGPDDIEIEGRKYLILREESILAIIE